MASGKRWTREELLIAMNLYCKLPFGKLDQRTPLIIAAAKKMGRTPSSLSMKLCNLASLDPDLKARGIKGLEGASQGDRDIWKQFHQNWNELGEESEELVEKLQLTRKSKKESNPTAPDETDAMGWVKQRRGQQFFRATVLASFNYRCCMTGNPIPELLRASHIASWKKHPEHRLNPQNGLCLAATQDAAFDRYLITLDKELRIILSKRLKEHFSNQSVRENFEPYEGKKIECPEKFEPDRAFLDYHRSAFSVNN